MNRPGPPSAKRRLSIACLVALAATAIGSCDFSQTDPAASLPATPTLDAGVRSEEGQGATPSAMVPSGTISETPVRPTPTPLGPVRLTSGGCCARPFWGPGSDGVYFLDRPTDGALGIYMVDLQGGSPSMIEPGAVELSADLTWMATWAGGIVTIRERDSGEAWRVPSDGRMIRFSPHNDWIVWQIQSSNVAYLDRRRWTLRLASLASHDVTTPLGGIGGGFVGWGREETTLLFAGRQALDGPAGLWRSSLTGENAELLFPSERIRSPLVSPDGGWVALTVAFSGDQALDGLWIVSTEGDGAFKAPLFGAYRWRSEGALLVIPLGTGGGAVRPLQVNVKTQETASVALGQSEPLDIAGNTWEISPDGRWLVYRSQSDGNLWLIGLPDVTGGT
jgi:hypothetical protein